MWHRSVVVVVLLAGFSGIFFRAGRERFGAIRQTTGNGLVVASWLLGLAAMATNFAAMAFVPRPRPSTEAVGLLLFLSGMGLWMWGRWTMGASFAQSAAIREGHRLVTSGPFRFVRNPLYLGNWISLAAHGMATGVYWSYPLVAIVVLLCVMRIRIEERMLTEVFGEEYVEYAKRTPRFVPGVR